MCVGSDDQSPGPRSSRKAGEGGQDTDRPMGRGPVCAGLLTNSILKKKTLKVLGCDRIYGSFSSERNHMPKSAITERIKMDNEKVFD